VLDAVGGAAVVAAGFGLAYVLQGPRAARKSAGAKSEERAGQRAPV
jgi:hypothetical protein